MAGVLVGLVVTFVLVVLATLVREYSDGPRPVDPLLVGFAVTLVMPLSAAWMLRSTTRTGVRGFGLGLLVGWGLCAVIGFPICYAG